MCNKCEKIEASLRKILVPTEELYSEDNNEYDMDCGFNSAIFASIKIVKEIMHDKNKERECL